jgi:hypothetical protein
LSRVIILVLQVRCTIYCGLWPSYNTSYLLSNMVSELGLEFLLHVETSVPSRHPSTASRCPASVCFSSLSLLSDYSCHLDGCSSSRCNVPLLLGPISMAALVPSLLLVILLVAPSDCSAVMLPICSAGSRTLFRTMDSDQVLNPMESISFAAPLEIEIAAGPSRSLSRSLHRHLPSPGRPPNRGRPLDRCPLLASPPPCGCFR